MSASWGPATFFIQRRKSTTKVGVSGDNGVMMLDGEEFAFNAELEDFESQGNADEIEKEEEDDFDESEEVDNLDHGDKLSAGYGYGYGYGSMLSKMGRSKQIPPKVFPSRSILSAAAGDASPSLLEIDPESPKHIKAAVSYSSVSSPYDNQLLLRKRYQANQGPKKVPSPFSSPSTSSSSSPSLSRASKPLFPAASTSPGVRNALAQAERDFKAVSSPMGHSLRQRKFHGQSKQNSDEKAKRKKDLLSEFGSPPSLRLGRLKTDTSVLHGHPAVSSSPYGGALLARKRRMSAKVTKKIEL